MGVRVRVRVGVRVGVDVRGGLVGLHLREIGETRGDLLVRQLLLRVDRAVADVVGHATARGGGPRGDPWAGVGGSRGGAAGRHAGDAKGMPKRRRIGRREILSPVMSVMKKKLRFGRKERNETVLVVFVVLCFVFCCFGFWFEKV